MIVTVLASICYIVTSVVNCQRSKVVVFLKIFVFTFVVFYAIREFCEGLDCVEYTADTGALDGKVSTALKSV